jgi:arylsulfatase A
MQINKRTTPTLLLMNAVLLTLCLAVQGLGEEVERPNFVVISCDNLGYGDVEPFGSKLHRTPHLNRMAREGRKFTHFCVTAGVCTPSRASLMTGCYSQRVGMHLTPRDGHVLRPISPYGLNPQEVTIAEVLKEQGYATAIFGKWHLGDQAEFLPTRQGFDEFLGVPYSDDMTFAAGQRIGDRFEGKNWPPLPLIDSEKVVDAPVDRNLLTRRYTERAKQFISQSKDKPFFLYMPQAMPGSTSTPYSSSEFRGKSRNGAWGDSVEELDWSTGQILDHLVQLKLAKNTLVIWTSDNGAPLARDINSPIRGSNLPLHGRGYTTAEGAFRVPTIMWWPGRIPAKTECVELATTMDLLPTFAALAGGQPPKHVIDGHDIRSLILATSDATTPYEVFYYYHMDQLQAVRSGPWKLFLPLKTFVRHPHFAKGRSSKPLLFNVVKDIGSKNNVAADHADVVARLTKLAEEGRRDLGDKGQGGTGQRQRGKVANPQPQVLQKRD